MKIPDSVWEELCEVISHPVGVVASGNRFLWVNSAFEQLVGYSRAELAEKTWMEITVQEDVGGDLASATAVVNGSADKYTVAKRYRHKLGQVIPIELTVWRFPRNSTLPMECFIVEAVPVAVDHQEVSALRHEFEQSIRRLEERLELSNQYDRRTEINRASTGGSVANNSSLVIIVVATVVVVGFCVTVGLMMSGRLIHHPQPAEPPPVVSPE